MKIQVKDIKNQLQRIFLSVSDIFKRQFLKKGLHSKLSIENDKYDGPSPQTPFLFPNYNAKGYENVAVKNKQIKKYFICLTQLFLTLLDYEITFNQRKFTSILPKIFTENFF